jgi:NADH pyrophosphatase NudC (nudix superfamily)
MPHLSQFTVGVGTGASTAGRTVQLTARSTKALRTSTTSKAFMAHLHLDRFYHTTRYCPRCEANKPFTVDETERALVCSWCGLRVRIILSEADLPLEDMEELR